MAFDYGRPSRQIGPLKKEVLSDSTGSYWLNFWGRTDLIYACAGYDTVRAVYPRDLDIPPKDQESLDPCIQLKRIELVRSRGK